MKKIFKFFKILIILVCVISVCKVSMNNQVNTVFNDNENKTLDLTAMAIKIEQIQMKDKYYPLDTYVGYLTGYVANCPLCGGTLGCTGQNVLDGTTIYNDVDYGGVNIMASSTSLKCGSIVTYNYDNEKITAIVLDRGVTGTNLDLLVKDEASAFQIGKKYLNYDVLRFGWTRE